MKNKNTAIVKNTVCIMLILAVFFCSLCGYTNTAFADDGELFTCDCPDCEGGTNTITTITYVDCEYCIGGYYACSDCDGAGFSWNTVTNSSGMLFYNYFGCASCGGSGYISSGSQSSSETAFFNSVASGSSVLGTGVGSTMCSVCSGTGLNPIPVITETTTDCPTCLGTGIIEIKITDVSNISTVVTTEDTDMTVTFSYSETGDVGDLEFIWYLSNNVYQVTYSPSVTLTGLPIGIYTMQCTINSSVGFSETTNTFEVWVNPASIISYISITEQPSSYTIKQGQAVSMSLDEETATNVAWYCNDEISLCDSYIYDLSALEIGEYDIYCTYSLDDEETTSETASITVVNESGLSSDEVIEGIETATENMSTGFWVAIGAGLATALLAWIVSRRNKS